MAGYCGYSKSNNAVFAEKCGEFPLSKWTKERFESVLRSVLGVESEIYVSLVSKPMTFVKKYILTSCGWHHTSSWYNTTDYYGFDPELWDDPVEIEVLYKKFKSERKAEKPQETPAKYRCRFLVWSGTRKHPKATEYEEIGEIKGNWFYCSFGKKSVSANGFSILEKIG